MTIAQAITQMETLQKENADPACTLYGALHPDRVRALQLLITVAKFRRPEAPETAP
jgi:hypothetical protein